MTQLVSIHGGHSGQFCTHAHDTLEAIVQAYIAHGFAWVGITEHVPPATEDFVYFDERDVGQDAVFLNARFADYFAVGRQLQQKYADQIELFIGCETETYTGSFDHIRQLVATYQPDYLVGSVHHVDDFIFDVTHEGYNEAAAQHGGLEGLYCRYFDQQYEMIEELRPQVIGHFDYIRILDPNYQETLQKTAVWDKIMRNLRQIKAYGLILDVNTKGLRKGHPEPYVSHPILQEAIALGIPLVPGDDSHGVADVGVDIKEGINYLKEAGAPTIWQKPC
ncbi:MAG: histidinol-phosphatase [Chloroflexota bacterium]